MTELKPRIHDESNGLDYVLVGDYYVPDLKLPEDCLLYTSPSPRDRQKARMPSSA